MCQDKKSSYQNSGVHVDAYDDKGDVRARIWSNRGDLGARVFEFPSASFSLLMGRREEGCAKRQVRVAVTYVKDNPRYKLGEPVLPTDELDKAGKSCQLLYKFYMSKVNSSQDSITIKYMTKHFVSASDGYFLITFGDLYDLFDLHALDVSLLRCWAL